MACDARATGERAPGPGLSTLHTALMLKICPPLARPGLPSLAAAAGSGAPSLPPACGAAPGSACPAPAARLGAADQVRRAQWFRRLSAAADAPPVQPREHCHLHLRQQL